MPSVAASVEAPTATVTSTDFVSGDASRVAVTVTVVADPSSSTEEGSTHSVTLVEAVSSSVIVPVAVSLAVTGAGVPDTDRLT